MNAYAKAIGVALAVFFLAHESRSAVFSVDFGPPDSARKWTPYSIALTHETFGVDSLEFFDALATITSLRIKAEMSTHTDSASLDSIRVGSQYVSTFNSGVEDWSIHNDATMVWNRDGGYEGACITLLDWASGTYFGAVSPPSWAGNWQALQGDTLSFYIRVNYCVTPGAVELHTDTTKRLSFLIEGEPSVAEGDTALVVLAVAPVSPTDLTVTLQTSNAGCITPLSPDTIPAGSSSIAIKVVAAEGSAGCESVIQAYASGGYPSARVTMTSAVATRTARHQPGRQNTAATPLCRYTRQGGPALLVSPDAAGVIRVYSMAGRNLATYAVERGGSRVTLEGLRAGMYVVRASLGTGVATIVIYR